MGRQTLEKKGKPVTAHIAVFKGKEIRKTLHEGEWFFVVQDVVGVLTDSADPKQYVKRMKQRDLELEKGWVQIVPTLPVQTDGGPQKMSCANTEGIFRIIQSIPSPKAEPFKRWLAKVGHERIQEIENPELAIKRMRATYLLKGYSEEWVDKRIRGSKVRKELTDEWEKRDVKEEKEYAILTSEISRATFGITPGEYKKHKGLDKPSENLRDHMTDLELIFTMLGEASTSEIAKNRDVYGLEPNKKAAREGGQVAGGARKELERKSGKKVVSAVNYKELPENEMRKALE